MKLKYLNTVLRHSWFLSPTYPLHQTPSGICHHSDAIGHPRTFTLTEIKTRSTGPNFHTPATSFCVFHPSFFSPQWSHHRHGSHWQPGLSDYIPSLYLLSLHSFRPLQPHSATIMWQWKMQVLNRPVYSIPSANWPPPINNGGPGALWLINGRASAPFHYT